MSSSMVAVPQGHCHLSVAQSAESEDAWDLHCRLERAAMASMTRIASQRPLTTALQHVSTESEAKHQSGLHALRATLDVATQHANRMKKLQAVQSQSRLGLTEEKVQALREDEALATYNVSSKALLKRIASEPMSPKHKSKQGTELDGSPKIIPSNKLDIVVDGEDQVQALLCAAGAGDLVAVQELINKGVDKNAKTCQQQSALHKAAANGHATVVLFLLRLGADVNTRDDSQWTPLHYAACHGSTTIAHSLLKFHAEMEAVEASGSTPLLQAVFHGHLDVVQYLTGAGANTSARDQRGTLAMQVASDQGYEKIAQFLRTRCINNTNAVSQVSKGDCLNALAANAYPLSAKTSGVSCPCIANSKELSTPGTETEAPRVKLLITESRSREPKVSSETGKSCHEFSHKSVDSTASTSSSAASLPPPSALGETEDVCVESQASPWSPNVKSEGCGAADISSSLIDFGSQLGQGIFGHVYKAHVDGKVVAVKCLNAKEFFKEDIVRLSRCCHTNLVMLLGITSDGSFGTYGILTITMELHPVSLYHRLHASTHVSLNRLRVLFETGSALSYLHRAEVCHGDLKSENVLLTQENDIVKLSDFGLAPLQACSKDAKPSARTLCYRAPELMSLSKRPCFSLKSDVFAFGVLTWEVCSNTIPYDKWSPIEIIVHTGAGHRLDIQEVANVDMRLLIRQAWAKDLAERPEMEFLESELSALSWESARSGLMTS